MQAYALAVIDGYQRDLAAAGPKGPALRPRRSATELPGAKAGAMRAVAIVPDVRMRFNPTRESSNLFVPGLMASC